MKINHSLSFQEWSTHIGNMGCHFGEWQGAASHWWPPATIPQSVEIDIADADGHDLDNNDDGDAMDVDGQGGNAGSWSAPFTHSQGGNAGFASTFNHNVDNGRDENAGDVIYPPFIPLPWSDEVDKSQGGNAGSRSAPLTHNVDNGQGANAGDVTYPPFIPRPWTDSQGGDAGRSASNHTVNNGPGQVARGSSPKPATPNIGDNQGGKAGAQVFDDQGANTPQSAPAPVTRNDGQPQGSDAGVSRPAASNYNDNNGHGENVGSFELASRMPTRPRSESDSDSDSDSEESDSEDEESDSEDEESGSEESDSDSEDSQDSNPPQSPPAPAHRNNGQRQGSNAGVFRPAAFHYNDNLGQGDNTGSFELASRMPTRECDMSDSEDESPRQTARAPVTRHIGRPEGSNVGAFRPATFNYTDNHGHGGNTGSWYAQSTNRTGRAQVGDNSGLASAPRNRHLFDYEGPNTRRSRSPQDRGSSRRSRSPLDRGSSYRRSRSPPLDRGSTKRPSGPPPARGSTKRRAPSPGPSDEGPQKRRRTPDAPALADNGAQGGDDGGCAASSHHTDNHGRDEDAGSRPAPSTNRTGRAQAGDTSGLASAPRNRHMSSDNEGSTKRRSRSPPVRGSTKRCAPDALALADNGAQGGDDGGCAASSNHTDNRGRGRNAGSFDPASRGRQRDESDSEDSNKRWRSPSFDASKPKKEARIEVPSADDGIPRWAWQYFLLMPEDEEDQAAAFLPAKLHLPDDHGGPGSAGSWASAPPTSTGTGRAQVGDTSGSASAPRERHPLDYKGSSKRRSRSPSMDRDLRRRRSRSPLVRGSRRGRSRSPVPLQVSRRRLRRRRTPPDAFALSEPGAQGGHAGGSATAAPDHTSCFASGPQEEEEEPAHRRETSLDRRADFLEAHALFREEIRLWREEEEAKDLASTAAKKAEEEVFDTMATGVASVAVGGPVVDRGEDLPDYETFESEGQGEEGPGKRPEGEKEGGESSQQK